MYILIFLIFFSFLLLVGSLIFNKKMNFNKEKYSTYECGFDIINIARTPFSLRFFKMSMMFVIFDIEIILITPLTFTFSNTNILLMMLIMMIIIILGFIFEWYQGSLEWIM
uniref:NADH-ubiquinone oxidoreductase chain 3 n=1 Tax=Dermanyssus gallinae TaxID=34641 RepID=A0A7U3SL74_9ACAR|nr:NADH dehydrogenase subunit 3 [Dermanyssus gallinae]QPG86044.1 NADH dehydrogenase subunit 3 [Dermanyssus gallinae]